MTFTLTVEDFSTSFLPKDRSSRQKLNGKILDLKGNINQIDLTDIYRTFHPNTKEYIFYSIPHGTLSKTDNVLGHKASLNKKIEITS